MKKQSVQIHVEPKDHPPYEQLPEDARNAMADALLVLIQRGRQVLAEQVCKQIEPAKRSKEADSRR
jgi:hypothetical protein